MSKPAIIEISLPTDPIGEQGWNSPSWTAVIKVVVNGIPSSYGSFGIRNRSLTNPRNRQDVKWFMEDHATTDPFDVSRAGDAESIIKEFSQDLVDDITAVYTVQSLRGQDVGRLIIQIIQGDAPSVLFALPWEVLYNNELWRERGIHFEQCSVERLVSSSKMNHSISAPTRPEKGVLNMLLLCVRPEVGSQSPANLTSEVIARLISDSPDVKARVRVHLVRPGTWQALARRSHRSPKASSSWRILTCTAMFRTIGTASTSDVLF